MVYIYAIMPNMTTMNHFNATPSSATTQLVPPSNTMSTTIGFSSGTNLDNGFNSQFNKGFASETSQFNNGGYPISSVGFLANTNGGFSQQGPFQHNFNSTGGQHNGYSQNNNGRNGNAGNDSGSNGYSGNNNGGYSDDNGGYPNFPTNRGTSHNNRNNGKGNYNNLIVCQICEKLGHGARKCFQRNSQQSQNGASSSSVNCQICKRPGHVAKNCFYRQQNCNNNNNSHNGNTAMVACCNNNSTPVQHEVWLTDSGATNHMTSNIQNLQNVTTYTSDDGVQFGNGQGDRQGSI
ncbi:probable cyclin-dependent serine/threonine-protein kinase DDB_G0292550 isoform X2 [Rosa chinensis]|uniref:probable cyclin-dependent serine/threonine-protein kinase DDB_G0292550 isoform X2 n=1 Tax=Rosa chinensis TaxID=74649 RepID=UPI000D08F548|nr:probable cyclin-dependent serine/threonine-protein kinase DDB_G0292550 isoform X2 [Rosa chinensis]